MSRASERFASGPVSSRCLNPDLTKSKSVSGFPGLSGVEGSRTNRQRPWQPKIALVQHDAAIYLHAMQGDALGA